MFSKFDEDSQKILLMAKKEMAAIEKYSNQKVKEKTLDNAVKRQEKTTKETIEKGYGKKRKTDKQNLRLSDTYLDNIKLLIDTVIDIKAESIRKQLKEKVVTK